MKKLTVKQLEKRMADGYAARNELQERKDAKLNKQHAALVGTCQKFKNSYGSSASDVLVHATTTPVGTRLSADHKIPSGLR